MAVRLSGPGRSRRGSPRKGPGRGVTGPGTGEGGGLRQAVVAFGLTFCARSSFISLCAIDALLLLSSWNRSR